MRLHGYRRCVATWRVQIALALKGVEVETLLRDPPDEASRAGLPPRLPLGLAAAVPAGPNPILQLPDGTLLHNAMAILEWLEEIWPSPALLPPDPATRARVRAFSQAIAGEIAMLHAARVLARLRATGASEGQAQGWARQAITEGLEAGEALLDDAAGPFCFGDSPGFADIHLVPQLQMARRFGVELVFPRLLAAEAASLTLPAFHATLRETQHA
ncbi:maleylacetoacetate isomerase [Pseudoroseomonas deserti]|uniref:Maleylacetoacetate isomerase n=1 Tax=Teichococcus deserti TaxID=1817963 RepID=A0A1V2GVM1_9PROT|nr:glutathione S-transferase N-terminal domain-containing protein [Pseudoroseomonas deserti]ONG46052.1 maleylacetoacetate isomerase [Pseudoroseomonas deserti]